MLMIGNWPLVIFFQPKQRTTSRMKKREKLGWHHGIGDRKVIIWWARKKKIHNWKLFYHLERRKKKLSQCCCFKFNRISCQFFISIKKNTNSFWNRNDTDTDMDMDMDMGTTHKYIGEKPKKLLHFRCRGTLMIKMTRIENLLVGQHWPNNKKFQYKKKWRKEIVCSKYY